MRPNIRTVILALLLVVCVAIGVSTRDTCTTHEVGDPPALTVGEKIVKHSLDFRMSLKDDMRTIGGGTYIEHEDIPYALTADHVWEALVERDRTGCIAICHKDDCVCVSTRDCVSSDTVEDWALIELPRALDGTKPAKISKRTRPVGTSVYIVGCPDGMALMVTHGIIAARVDTPGEPFPHYVVDGYAFYGSSGGGLFTSNGVYIGIVTQIPSRVGVLLGFQFPIENPNLVIITPLSEVLFP